MSAPGILLCHTGVQMASTWIQRKPSRSAHPFSGGLVSGIPFLVPAEEMITSDQLVTGGRSLPSLLYTWWFLFPVVFSS